MSDQNTWTHVNDTTNGGKNVAYCLCDDKSVLISALGIWTFGPFKPLQVGEAEQADCSILPSTINAPVFERKKL